MDRPVDCLPCAALRLVRTVQDRMLKFDQILIDFPLEEIEEVMRLIEPHFEAAYGHRRPS